MLDDWRWVQRSLVFLGNKIVGDSGGSSGGFLNDSRFYVKDGDEESAEFVFITIENVISK